MVEIENRLRELKDYEFQFLFGSFSLYASKVTDEYFFSPIKLSTKKRDLSKSDISLNGIAQSRSS